MLRELPVDMRWNSALMTRLSVDAQEKGHQHHTQFMQALKQLHTLTNQ